MISQHNCRFCNEPLTHVLMDLGFQPPSNSFLTEDDLVGGSETYYPLRLYICSNCRLVQIPEAKKAEEIFTDNYVYFSSESPSNIAHARRLCSNLEDAGFISYSARRKPRRVIEIGSNDGYLIGNLIRGCDCIGFEPARACAELAIKRGVNTRIERFSLAAARTVRRADVIIGINVLAHQPNIVDFVKGLKRALRAKGTVVMEFPHLHELVKHNQFDTIYHEHYSYFSLHTVSLIFLKCGLKIYHAEKIPQHGGSLRIFATHQERHIRASASYFIILRKECPGKSDLPLSNIYRTIEARAKNTRNELNVIIRGAINQHRYTGRTPIMAYGAAAKGNTLLNYCGIRNDMVGFVADRSKYKQGLFLPGSHAEVVPESAIKDMKPAYVLILPWNLETEIRKQLSYIDSWGGQFIIPIPEPRIVRAREY